MRTCGRIWIKVIVFNAGFLYFIDKYKELKYKREINYEIRGLIKINKCK